MAALVCAVLPPLILCLIFLLSRFGWGGRHRAQPPVKLHRAKLFHAHPPVTAHRPSSSWTCTGQRSYSGGFAALPGGLGPKGSRSWSTVRVHALPPPSSATAGHGEADGEDGVGDDEADDIDTMSFMQLVALMEEVGGPELVEGTPLEQARDEAWRFVEQNSSDSHDHSHGHSHGHGDDDHGSGGGGNGGVGGANHDRDLARAEAAQTSGGDAGGNDRSRRQWAQTALAAASITTTVGRFRPGWARAETLESDEYAVRIEQGSVGIELEEISRYRNVASRVQVKRLVAGGQAEKSGVAVQDVLVSVNGFSLETGGVKRAYEMIQEAPRPATLVLRKPERFTELLNGRSRAEVEAGTTTAATVSTEIAPADRDRGNGLAEKQVLTVRSENVSGECVLGAQKGDLLEIAYTGRLAETGYMFDGSRRGGDTSVYFVLGNQPFGQFPPGWDLTLEGMCIGEKRIITVPPALGFGAKGVPRRNIPPNAGLVYEVRLLSVNGDAQVGRTVELPDRGVVGLGGAFDGGGR